jgi:hypothetical protein
MSVNTHQTFDPNILALLLQKRAAGGDTVSSDMERELQRMFIQKMSQDVGDTSPIVHPMQGVARLGNAAIGGMLANKMAGQERAEKAEGINGFIEAAKPGGILNPGTGPGLPPPPVTAPPPYIGAPPAGAGGPPPVEPAAPAAPAAPAPGPHGAASPAQNLSFAPEASGPSPEMLGAALLQNGGGTTGDTMMQPTQPPAGMPRIPTPPAVGAVQQPVQMPTPGPRPAPQPAPTPPPGPQSSLAPGMASDGMAPPRPPANIPNIDPRMAISAMGETGRPDFSNQAQIAPDTAGSKSYGVLGLNTWGRNPAATSAGRFAAEYGPQLGLTARPGSPEFDAQWRRAAQTNPQALAAAQQAFHQKNIVGNVAPGLARVGVPEQLANDPRVQAYMADRMVQQGEHSIGKHANRIQAALMAAQQNPEAFLQRLSQLDKQSIPQDFRTYLSTNPNNVRGLANRVDKRQNLALGVSQGNLAQAQPQGQPPLPRPRPPELGGDQGVPSSPSQEQRSRVNPRLVQLASLGGLPTMSSAALGEGTPEPTTAPQRKQAREADAFETKVAQAGGLPPDIDEAKLRKLLGNRFVGGAIQKMLLERMNPEREIKEGSDGYYVFDKKSGNLVGKHPKPPSNAVLERYDNYYKQETAAGRKPMSQIEYESSLARDSRNLTTIDQRGPNKFEDTYGEGMGKRALAVGEAATKATVNLQRTHLLKGMLSDIKTGKLAQTGATMGSWLQSFGINPESVGINPNMPATAEAATALINKEVMANIGSNTVDGAIPANNFSNADREFLIKTVPSLANRPEANEVLLEVKGRTEELAIERAEMWREARRQRIDYDTFEGKWNDHVKSRDIFGDLREKLKNAGGGPTPAPAPAPGGELTIQQLEAEIARRKALQGAPR